MRLCVRFPFQASFFIDFLYKLAWICLVACVQFHFKLECDACVQFHFKLECDNPILIGITEGYGFFLI